MFKYMIKINIYYIKGNELAEFLFETNKYLN